MTADGMRGVSTSPDRTLRLWDLDAGRQVAIFECSDRARSCTVSPDGRIVVAGDASGMIHVLILGPEQEHANWSGGATCAAQSD